MRLFSFGLFGVLLVTNIALATESCLTPPKKLSQPNSDDVTNVRAYQTPDGKNVAYFFSQPTEVGFLKLARAMGPSAKIFDFRENAYAANLVTDPARDLFISQSPPRENFTEGGGKERPGDIDNSSLLEKIWQSAYPDSSTVTLIRAPYRDGTVPFDLKSDASYLAAQVWMDGLLGEMAKTLSDGGTLGFHCHAGKGRTGIAQVAFSVAFGNRSLNEAIAEAHAFGLDEKKQIEFIRNFFEYWEARGQSYQGRYSAAVKCVSAAR